MKILLSENLIEKYPNHKYVIGIVKNIQVEGPNKYTEVILNSVYPKVERRYTNRDLKQLTNSLAYQDLARKLPGERFSYPHLQLKRVLDGKKINNINNIVNLYMKYELLYNFSFSVYDLDKITGDLYVEILGSQSTIRLLSGDTKTLHPDDIVFKDRIGIIYSYMSGYAERTKITSDSSKVLYLLDAPGEINYDEANSTMDQLLGNFDNHKKYLLSRNNIKIEI